MSRHRLLPASLVALLAAFAAVRGGPAVADGPAGAPLPPPARPPAAGPGLFDLLPAASRPTYAYLVHLGWRFVEDPAATEVRVVEGRPGYRATVDEARAAGDLVIVVPAGRSPATLAALAAVLGPVADGVGSRLAWQLRMKPAVEAATARLSAAADRGTYGFPSVLGITSPIFAFTPPEGLWVERPGGAYAPRGSPSAAIAAFGTRSCLAECLVGQAVATLEIQRTLLGDAAFDEVYPGDDAAVGRLDGYQRTPIGRALAADGEGAWQALLIRTSEVGTADPGALLARYGPAAFVGFTGFLHDQTGADRANENIVVVSCTEAASEALRTEGGFPLVSALTAEYLELRNAERAPFMTAAKLEPIRARQRAIEAHPVLAGIRIYIHPHGVKTLGEIAAKHRNKNKSAVELYPYVSARDDAYYQRYRAAFERRFARGEAPR